MYNAFISYSHAADGKLAPALQTALEKFAKPWYQIRYLNIFRDEASLTVSPQLWINIREALAASEYLIYMASPTSRVSKWIIKEIEFWLENKSIETLLIVLTDGEITWDNELKCFSNNDTNSLPYILQNSLTEEPFYVDLRTARTEVDLSLNNPIFKKEVLKLAAQLHGKQPKDLASEEVVAYRKMKRIRNTAIGTLAVLFGIAVMFSWLANANANKAQINLVRAQENQIKADSNATIAIQQKDSAIIARNLAAYNAKVAQLQRDTAEIERNNAIFQKKVAIEQRNRAQANYLWSQSKSALETNPTLAIRLAEQAALTFKDPEIERDLRSIYYSNSFYKILPQNNVKPVKSYLAISPDNRKGFNVTYKNNDFEWEEPEPVISDIGKDTIAGETKPYIAALELAAFSPDGRKIVYSSKDEIFKVIDLEGHMLFTIDMEEDMPVRSRWWSTGLETKLVAFSNEGDRILIYFGGKLKLWKLDNNKLLQKLQQKDITKILLSKNGNKILLGYANGKVQLWDWDGNKQIDYLGQKSYINSLAFSPNERKVIAGSVDSTVQVWNLNGTPLQKLTRLPAPVFSAIISHDGDKIATVCSNNVVQLWNSDGRVTQEFKSLDELQCSVQFSSDGKAIITSTKYNSELRSWEIKTNIVKEFKFDSTQIRNIAFSPDGQYFVSTSVNKSFISMLDHSLTSKDTKVRIWNENGNIIKELATDYDYPSDIVFAPDGNTFLVIFNSSYTIQYENEEKFCSQAILWDLNGKLKQAFKSTSQLITACVFSPSGKKLLLGTNERAVEVWDINGTLIYRAEASGDVTSMTISLDEKSVCFISEEHGVRYPGAFLGIVDLNSLNTREIDLELRDFIPYTIEFSPDGKNIIADQRVIWDLNGEFVGEFKIDAPSGSHLPRYSRDRQTKAASLTIDENNNLLLKDQDAVVTDIFVGHKGYVAAAVISPDEKKIVSGDSDGKIIIWKPQIQVQDFLKSDKLEALSEEQRKKYNIDNF